MDHKISPFPTKYEWPQLSLLTITRVPLYSFSPVAQVFVSHSPLLLPPSLSCLLLLPTPPAVPQTPQTPGQLCIVVHHPRLALPCFSPCCVPTLFFLSSLSLSPPPPLYSSLSLSLCLSLSLLLWGEGGREGEGSAGAEEEEEEEEAIRMKEKGEEGGDGEGENRKRRGRRGRD